MNREIKFRAWDKEKKEMFFPISLQFLNTSILYKNGLSCIIKDEPTMSNSVTEFVDEVNSANEFDCGAELMQYTGLKDKNGKEIYEGDVVMFPSRNSVEVEFKRGSFWADYPIHTIPEGELEVIGNIYENPELLTNFKQEIKWKR